MCPLRFKRTLDKTQYPDAVFEDLTAMGCYRFGEGEIYLDG
jgi:hypothetical protein